MTKPCIAITAGEPAGVGPDLVLRLASASAHSRYVIIADRSLLTERALHLGIPVTCRDYDPANQAEDGVLDVYHVPLCVPAEPGRLNPKNARYVLATLDKAIAGCQLGHFAALVTGPIHKAVINEAGIPFTGHTEYLAQQTQAGRVVMMLVGGGMRVALATTHLPLRDVADTLTIAQLTTTLQILHHDLVYRFLIPKPRILVAGLNPHAGESGHIGREEIDIIAPTLAQLRQQGMQLDGPLPADTLFQTDQLARCDAILAMYHDQGLPALKQASFGQAVNITLGLPILRTSVDHGTALSLAGTGHADCGSFLAAIALAEQLATRSKK